MSDTEEKLIDLVRKKPVLYDVSLKGYSNLNLKAKIWNNIATNCNIKTGDDAKAVWIKLRDSYRSSLKRVSRADEEGYPTCSTKWKYSEQMLFLKPHMKDRKRKCRINTTHKEEYVASNDAVSSSPSNDYPVSACEIVLQPPTTTSSQPTQMCSNVQTVIATLNQQKEACHKSVDGLRQQLLQPPDELKLFFEAMFESAKKLSPSLQRMVKRKLFAILSEAEDMMEITGHDQTT